MTCSNVLRSQAVFIVIDAGNDNAAQESRSVGWTKARDQYAFIVKSSYSAT